ncbi:MAG TPA: AAA family ATPase, partial [Nocardioides sp.]|nr:AAA family ATPase [Nocardioides sp.]
MAERNPGETVTAVAEVAQRIRANVERVIEGKSDAVTAALVVLLAEGHLLLEDVPGVGKTMLSKALARSIDATVRRIQFTPDLLPSDVTGVSVYDQS